MFALSSKWQFEVHWRDCHLLVCICFCTLLVSSLRRTVHKYRCTVHGNSATSFRLWKFKWRVRILRIVQFVGLNQRYLTKFPFQLTVALKFNQFHLHGVWCWIGIDGKGRFKQFKSSSWAVNQQTWTGTLLSIQLFVLCTSWYLQNQ